MGRKACTLDGHTGRSSNDLNASFDPNYLKNHKGHENNHHERNDRHTRFIMDAKVPHPEQ